MFGIHDHIYVAFRVIYMVFWMIYRYLGCCIANDFGFKEKYLALWTLFLGVISTSLCSENEDKTWQSSLQSSVKVKFLMKGKAC